MRESSPSAVHKQPVPLLAINQGTRCIISSLEGGADFRRRLRNIGVSEGKKLKVVAKYPFSGPIVIEVDGRKITIGRGMASKIAVEFET